VNAIAMKEFRKNGQRAATTRKRAEDQIDTVYREAGRMSVIDPTRTSAAMTAAATVMPTRDVTIGDTFVRTSGQGFPLVFVHGFTTTSEFWKEQTEEFSKTYRVIRINLPGHGASPAPTSRSYCLEDFVEDVARVFRELNIEKAVDCRAAPARPTACREPQLRAGMVNQVTRT
jgi:pimeloyl-ACP methyl ester carboxylesterase